MRDVEGRSAERWLGERLTDAIAGAPVWKPSADPQARPTLPSRWWQVLHFDDSGEWVDFNHQKYPARELALTDIPYAESVRDELAGGNEQADKNNWACASIYADPAAVVKVHQELEKFEPKNSIIQDNLALMAEHLT